ncbi:MAG: SMI1/KNR4 family protein [Planctomycetota bacterium]
MNAIEVFSSAAGLSVVDEDGHTERIQLMPPVTESELATIERELGFALPTEARALLRMTSGLAGTALDQFQFVDVGGQALPDLFPHPLSIAHDGYGNFWIVDLWPSSDRFGPVFYVAHDPPVVVYQCEDVASFAQHVLEFSSPHFSPRPSRGCASAFGARRCIGIDRS